MKREYYDQTRVARAMQAMLDEEEKVSDTRICAEQTRKKRQPIYVQDGKRTERADWLLCAEGYAVRRRVEKVTWVFESRGRNEGRATKFLHTRDCGDWL